MKVRKPIQIANYIYFIGVFDPDIRTIDIIMKTATNNEDIDFEMVWTNKSITIGNKRLNEKNLVRNLIFSLII